MSERPIVRKTYGRVTRPSTSSSSILFTSTSGSSSSRIAPLQDSEPSLRPGAWSSSPPSSSALATPYGPSEDDAFEPGSSSPVRGKYPIHQDGEDKPLDDDSLKPSTSKTQTTLKNFFLPPATSKRPLKPAHTVTCLEPRKRIDTSSSSKSRNLTQMHLTHLPLLHTCKECSMSYVRGGGEDETLHAKHHSRVVRGIPWDGLGRSSGNAKESRRGHEKAMKNGGCTVIGEDVAFGSARSHGKGKVIMCEGSWGGVKLLEICAMVDTVLSAPALPIPILETCKIFLFITSSSPPNPKRLKPNAVKLSNRDRIVSVVVAQPIKVAMRVLKGDEDGDGGVDSGGGVVCDPTPLSTPLGIHRLFTIPSYRSLSLSRILLDAACSHTIYGMTLDPAKGQVAFSQPTDSGRRMMERWGRGGVRVFVDDDRQL